MSRLEEDYEFLFVEDLSGVCGCEVDDAFCVIRATRKRK